MGCTESLTRTFVFIVNFAFLLVGVALLAVGILYRLSFTQYTAAIPDDFSAFQYIPIFSIVVGAIIIFISFLGCCGACKANTCMLTWYGAILIIIFLLQIGLGVYAFLQVKDNSTWNQQAAQQISKIFSEYSNYREIVDLIQQNFQCCGTTDPSSWQGSIPNSCYPNKDPNQTRFDQGCTSLLSNFLYESVRIIGIVAVSIAAVEVVGAILALCLTSCIRERRRKDVYY